MTQASSPGSGVERSEAGAGNEKVREACGDCCVLQPSRRTRVAHQQRCLTRGREVQTSLSSRCWRGSAAAAREQ